MSWTRLIMNHIRTPMECADELGMTPEDVNKHIYEHVSDNAFDDPNSPDYTRKKMLKFVTILESWFDDMTVEPKIDRSTMEIALKLVKEITNSIKVIGEIDGQLNKVDPKVQIINITNDYKRLTGILMMDLCDCCRPNVMRVIEQMQGGPALLPDSSTTTDS